MGGFVLDPPDFVPFPLNVNQVHYLVCHGYIEYGAVHLRPSEISDRNKFDGMSRLITTAQLFSFVINTLARAAEGLAITTLEVSTIGFVYCSLCTYLVWRHKSQDVTDPIRLIPKVSMAEILVLAGQQLRSRTLTFPWTLRGGSHTGSGRCGRTYSGYQDLWAYISTHERG